MRNENNNPKMMASDLCKELLSTDKMTEIENTRLACSDCLEEVEENSCGDYRFINTNKLEEVFRDIFVNSSKKLVA